MMDLTLTFRNLQSMKSIGLRLAVHEFGTGHSSLTYFEQLPVDTLKSDRSFAGTINSGDCRARPTPATIPFSSTLGLTAFAEGVD